MVSKASEDLPLPERPVRTIRLSRGRVRSMFLRLCSLAPRISMVSCGTCYLAYPEAVVRPPPLCRRAAASGDEHVYVTRQEVPRPVPSRGTVAGVGGARWATGLRGQPDAGAAKASTTSVSSNWGAPAPGRRPPARPPVG